MIDFGDLEVLTEYECFQLLGKVPVGRIVFVDRALPAIQPVNFAVDGRSVVVRTGSRSRLAVAASRTVVAFEADEFSESSSARSGWSVVAVGRAEQITDSGQLEVVRRLDLKPWVSGMGDCFLRVPIELISGRRLGA